MEMLIGGTWQRAANGQTEDVTSPFDGAVVGPVPVADADDVRIALDRAEAGAAAWRRTAAHERMRILVRAAELADERAGLTAEIISAEAGKTITEATGEASRSGDLIRLAAFEGTQLYGDADIELAATAVAAGGYINAGQVCISVQRVITHPAVEADFLDALVEKELGR